MRRDDFHNREEVDDFIVRGEGKDVDTLVIIFTRLLSLAGTEELARLNESKGRI